MTENNKARIAELQAEQKRLELEDVRNEVLTKDEPGWLSEADKYMVSVTPYTHTPGETTAEVNVYRWNQIQSGGNLTAADIVTLRDYLTTLIPKAEKK